MNNLEFEYKNEDGINYYRPRASDSIINYWKPFSSYWRNNNTEPCMITIKKLCEIRDLVTVAEVISHNGVSLHYWYFVDKNIKMYYEYLLSKMINFSFRRRFTSMLNMPDDIKHILCFSF